MNNLIFDKQTHSYYLGDKKLISVSKIINNYLGSIYDGIDKYILKNAALRGQWVHKVNEWYLKNINKENIINIILEKIKPLIKDENKYLLCEKSLNFIKKELTNKNEYDIEKPIYFQDIAGIPDLLVKEKDKNYLIDYKTYSRFTPELKEKAILQMTAYYWILTNNGISVSNNAYIYWINKNIKRKIEINITEKELHAWKMAIESYKEWESN